MLDETPLDEQPEEELFTQSAPDQNGGMMGGYGQVTRNTLTPKDIQDLPDLNTKANPYKKYTKPGKVQHRKPPKPRAVMGAEPENPYQEFLKPGPVVDPFENTPFTREAYEQAYRQNYSVVTPKDPKTFPQGITRETARNMLRRAAPTYQVPHFTQEDVEREQTLKDYAHTSRKTKAQELEENPMRAALLGSQGSSVLDTGLTGILNTIVAAGAHAAAPSLTTSQLEDEPWYRSAQESVQHAKIALYFTPLGPILLADDIVEGLARGDNPLEMAKGFAKGFSPVDDEGHFSIPGTINAAVAAFGLLHGSITKFTEGKITRRLIDEHGITKTQAKFAIDLARSAKQQGYTHESLVDMFAGEVKQSVNRDLAEYGGAARDLREGMNPALDAIIRERQPTRITPTYLPDGTMRGPAAGTTPRVTNLPISEDPRTSAIDAIAGRYRKVEPLAPEEIAPLHPGEDFGYTRDIDAPAPRDGTAPRPKADVKKDIAEIRKRRKGRATETPVQPPVEDGVTPTLKPEPTPSSGNPIAVNPDRWENDRGAMPGEPFATTKDGKVGIVEHVQDDGTGSLYEVIEEGGRTLGKYSTPKDAAEAGERFIDSGSTQPAQEPKVKHPHERHYIRIEGKHVEVDGTPVHIPGAEDGDLFLHTFPKDEGYGVSDGRTGTSLGSGKTPAEAIESATKNLEKNAGKFENAVHVTARKYGVSPRWQGRYEPPAAEEAQTLGTEAKTRRGGVLDDLPASPTKTPETPKTSDTIEEGHRENSSVRNEAPGSSKDGKAEDVPGAGEKRSTGDAPSREAEGSRRADGESDGRPGAKSDGGDGDRAERPVAAEREGAAGNRAEETKPGRSEESGSPSADESNGQVDGESTPPAVAGERARNYRVTDEDNVGQASTSAKTTDLVNAVETLRKIEKENRQATPEEQQVLVKFPGWGWTGNMLHPKNAFEGSTHFATYKRITEAISPAELKAARKAALNSHFTSPAVIDAVWSAVDRIGFKHGKALEPSAGIGLFLGRGPEGIKWDAVELDSLTGRILGHLYPEARVQNTGLQDAALRGDFDLVISNVPFGNFPITDAALLQATKNPALFSRIHNYFFAKGLEVARPGGIVAFITSHGTLDATDAVGVATRAYLAEHADLIGAIRLPNNAFLKNAGTEVTTDIIFLRKRPAGEAPTGEAFQTTLSVDTPDGPAHVNEYFVNHPDMALGEHTLRGKMYGAPKNYALIGQGDISESLAAAIKNLPENIYEQGESKARGARATSDVPLPPKGTRQGALYTVEGKVYFKNRAGLGEAVTASAEEGKALQKYGILRDQTLAHIQAMIDGVDDAQLKQSQEALKDAYDQYVKAHGPLNGKFRKLLRGDPDAYTVLNLEKWDAEKKRVTGLADIFSKRVIQTSPRVEYAETAHDALIVSLRSKGKVDLEEMARLTKRSVAEITKELTGHVFHDPVKDTWETADEYGSGNVRKKLKAAKEAGDQEAVKFLETRQPPALMPEEITANPGATWIPKDLYGEFLGELIDADRYELPKATYSEPTSAWKLTYQRYGAWSGVAAREQWGGGGMNAADLFEHLLNSKDPKVYDKTGDKPVVDEIRTAQAKAKMEEIRAKWHEWVYADSGRAAKLADIYNEEVNAYAPRVFDGSILEFSGMNPEFKPRPHQANAALRIIQRDTTLLDHGVGTGKTATMVMSAMELRRTGTRIKPMLAVKNSTVEQIASAFKTIYPGSKILVAADENFSGMRRKDFMGQIATGDWDSVLVTHSAFTELSMSPAAVQSFYDAQIEALQKFLYTYKKENPGGSRSDDFTVKEVEKAITRLETRLDKIQTKLSGRQDTDATYWEQLGVDHLFVDEAHDFKNLFFTSQLDGMGQEGSQRALDLYMKIAHLREQGGGITFSTGTPISNSIAEMHTMLKYLNDAGLKEQKMEQFDAWARTFATSVSDIERDVAGRYRTKARLARFDNVPELQMLYREVADVVHRDDVEAINVPKLTDREGKVTDAPMISTSKPSEMQKRYFQLLVKRAEKIKGQRVFEKGMDNMLSISTDGRKASLDMRLVDAEMPDDPDSKINNVVRNVFEIWKDPKVAARKGTQMVFLDYGTPGSASFNLYADMKAKLIRMGIPREEIAFIHDAKTDAQTGTLFKKMNSGEVRVLIASTNKGGVGVNVQRLLKAIHHVDPAWRPADMEQRTGRMVRDGNLWLDGGVHEYHYATTNSYDEFMWHKLKTKQAFIDQLMKGELGTRSIEDIGEDPTFSFGEMAAIASGNPKIREFMQATQRIKDLENLRAAHQRTVQTLRGKVNSYSDIEIPNSEAHIKTLKAVIVERDKGMPKDFEITVKGKRFTEMKDAGIRILELARDVEPEQTRSIANYGPFGLEVEGTKTGTLHLWLTEPKTNTRVWMDITEQAYRDELDLVGASTMRRINEKISKFDDNLENEQRKLSTFQKELAKAKEEVQKPWKLEDEYVKVKGDTTRLQSEIGFDLEKGNTGAWGVDIAESVRERQLEDVESDIAEVQARRDARASGMDNKRRGAVNIGPDDIADAYTLGKLYLEYGYRSVKAWTTKMVKEFGEEIRPHLDAIYKKAHEDLGISVEKPEGKKGSATGKEAPKPEAITEAGPEPETTSVKNEAALAAREKLGLADDLPKPERETFQQWVNEAKAQGLDSKEAAVGLAEDVLQGKQDVLTHIESAGIALRMTEIKNRVDEVREQIRAAQEDGSGHTEHLRYELGELRDEFDTLTKATKQAGTPAARYLVSRKLTLNSDYSLASVGQRLKDEAGIDLQENGPLEKHFEKITKRIKEINARLDEMNEEAANAAAKEAEREVVRSRRSSKHSQTKEKLDEEWQGLTQEWKEATLEAMAGTNIGVNIPKFGTIIGKMVANRIHAGAVSLEEAIEQVLHEVRKTRPETTEREVRDFFSGYGFESEPKTLDAAKVRESELKRLARLISLYEDLSAGKTPPKTGNRAKVVRSQREIDLLDKIKRLKAKLDPGARADEALKSYKTRVTREIAELKEQIAKGDFTKKKRTKIVLDEEGIRLKAEKEILQRKVDEEIARRRPKSLGQRALDAGVSTHRAFVLSGYQIFGKLAGASAWQVPVALVEDIVSLPFGQMRLGGKSLAAQSGRFGYSNPLADLRGLADLPTRGIRNAFDSITKGMNQIDALAGSAKADGREYGGPGKSVMGVIGDLPGRSHGAVKALLQTQTYRKSLTIRLQRAKAAGIDVNNPEVQHHIAMQAAIDAQDAILKMSPTGRMINQTLEQWTHHKQVGPRVLGWVGKFMLPIVGVPSKYVGKAIDYTGVGLVRGALKHIVAARRGEATPEMATQIMHAYTRGGMGLVAAYIAFNAPGVIKGAGYYRKGAKPGDYGTFSDGEAMEPGDLELFGTLKVSHQWAHNPWVEALQFWSTMKQAYAANADGDELNKMGSGLFYSTGGLLEQAPGAEQLTGAVAPLMHGEENAAGKGLARLLQGMIQPQFVASIARTQDKDASGKRIKRKTKGFRDEYIAGMPKTPIGALPSRQDLPIKE